MITEALLALVNILVIWLVSVRPSWDIDLPAGFDTVFMWMRALDPILPVSEVLICMSAGVVLVGALQGWKWVIKLVDWVADVIP